MKGYEDQVRLLLDVLPLLLRNSSFALKGGTAINLFIRDMPRLSVDIDLTYLPIEPRAETISNINSSLKKSSHDISKKLKGVKIFSSKAFDSQKELKLFIERGETKIKVEPNYILRGSVFLPVQRDLSHSCHKKFGVVVKSQTLSFEDIFGGKICAALDRQHPRDLFDIKQLLDRKEFTSKVKTAFLVYLMSHNRPMNELLAPNFQDITKSYESEFSGMTFEETSREQLEESREKLLQKIHELLTDRDRSFLLSFKSGKPKWEEFPVSHISQLPGIQWKQKNLTKVSFDKLRTSIKKLENALGN